MFLARSRSFAEAPAQTQGETNSVVFGISNGSNDHLHKVRNDYKSLFALSCFDYVSTQCHIIYILNDSVSVVALPYKLLYPSSTNSSYISIVEAEKIQTIRQS